MHYRLHPKLARALLNQTASAAPREVCGFACGYSIDGLIEFNSSIQVPNISANPTQEFLIDGLLFREVFQRIEAIGLILAIWHSHPTSKPVPSRPDLDLIKQLHEIPFIIVGVLPPIITIYEVVEGDRVRQAERFYIFDQIIMEAFHHARP